MTVAASFVWPSPTYRTRYTSSPSRRLRNVRDSILSLGASPGLSRRAPSPRSLVRDQPPIVAGLRCWQSYLAKYPNQPTDTSQPALPATNCDLNAVSERSVQQHLSSSLVVLASTLDHTLQQSFNCVDANTTMSSEAESSEQPGKPTPKQSKVAGIGCLLILALFIWFVWAAIINPSKPAFTRSNATRGCIRSPWTNIGGETVEVSTEG